MGGVREYQYDRLFETSQVPSGDVPVNPDDQIPLDYLENKSYWAAPRNNVAAMRSLDAANRRDIQVRKLRSPNSTWYFDEDSTASDDGSTVLKPDDIDSLDPGRWLIDSSGGGGGGGGGSGIEQVLQKAEMEKQGIFTEAIDNSIIHSCTDESLNTLVLRLLASAASGQNVIEAVINPIYLDDSDKDTDSTTGWTAVGAGTSLGTDSTNKKIGAASLTFDKTTGNTEAGIRKDRGSQNFSYANNTELFYWIYLPSTSALLNVYVKIYKDSTSNYNKYLITQDVAGNPLAVGENLIKVDVKNDSSTSTGTGWAYTDLSRYTEIGLDTSNASQTYSGIRIDAVMASAINPDELGLKGHRLSLFDNSNLENVVLDASNTRYSGRMTLAANLTNTYAGGTSAAAASSLKRATLSVSGLEAGFDSSLSSGAVALTQAIRTSRILRDTIAGTITSVVDLETPQFNIVTTVGGSTIGVEDPDDMSANYVNTNVVEVFRPVFSAGKRSYEYIGQKTLTANSSHSSGTTTLTLPVSGVQVKDIIVKRIITSQISCVAKTANEAFGNASIMADPNGIQVLDDFLKTPYKDKLIGDFSLGGNTGFNNKAKNPILSFTTAGTLNKGDRFLYGRNSTSGWSGSNYFYLDTPFAPYFQGATRTVMSLWAYLLASDGSNNRNLFNFFSSPNTGLFLTVNQTGNTLNFFNESTGVSAFAPFNPSAWNHILMHFIDNNIYAYVNGVKSSLVTNAMANASLPFVFGTNATGSGAPLNSSERLADLKIWNNCPEFSAQDAASIYNKGNYRPCDIGSLRYMYEDTGQSGQKVSHEAVLTRTTSAVKPTIRKMALHIAA